MDQDNFSFSKELEQLQRMVLDFAEESPEDEVAKLAFYETVVERTVTSLKWFNANSKIFEERTTKKLLEAEQLQSDLQRKLDRLLEKAARLRIENKELKQKSKLFSTDTLKMARMILGLQGDVDKDAIKKAYRNKAKKVHPDRESGDADLFKALTEAMVLLIAHQEID